MHKLLINPNQRISKIHKDIYGHFSEHLGRCIYEGFFVTDDSGIKNVNGMRCDVVNALKDMKIPVLRWPGGCFADEYHWMDGIGPKETRKKMINTHWGGVVEDNSFGTHEFFELCNQLGCDAYITGNVGSGSVRELSEWIEYMTFDGLSPMSELRKQNGREEPWKLQYLGVGNENWGCGGNMYPEFYADNYRRYNTYARDYRGSGHIQRIACGANGEDYTWTDVLMRKVGGQMDGLSLHYYTVTGDWGHKGSATDFTDDEYYTTIGKACHIDEIITRHDYIMSRYDPKKRISMVIDEWGTWFDVEPGTNPGFLYQQNTMRDAIVAGCSLNIFNKHSDRVRMANIAQTVNVLQAVALTEGEKLILTPTYYIFKMYADHQNNTLIGSYITHDFIGDKKYPCPDVNESVSIAEDGTIYATIVNTSLDTAAEISCQIADTSVKSVTAEILTDSCRAFNTFDNPEVVKTQTFADYTLTSDGFTSKIPACSVVKFVIK